VLQTKRLYGAITQAEKKFPQTSNYFRLLFAGDLGYTPIAEFAARPGLFGLTIPDELFDESFTVYDHPKVLVFKNTGRLSDRALLDAMLRGIPSRPMTRKDILLTHAGAAPAAPERGLVRASIPALVLAVLLLEALALAGFALLAP